MLPNLAVNVGPPRGQREPGCQIRVPDRGLQLRSLVTSSQTVELSLQDTDIPAPGPDQVVLRVEAAPINPSDLGLLFAGATWPRSPPPARRTARSSQRRSRPGPSGRAGRPGSASRCRSATRAPAPSSRPGLAEPRRPCWARRSRVAGGAMYAQYRVVNAAACLQLPDGATASDGAVVVRQPADRAGHGRDDAAGGPHRPGAHRRRVQPGPDAEPALPRGADPAGEHRPQPAQADLLRAAGATWVCDSSLADVHGRPDRGADGHPGHPGVRRHRRRPAGQPDPRLHGGGGQRPAPSTAATGRRCTSRCTSTAAWTAARPS